MKYILIIIILIILFLSPKEGKILNHKKSNPPPTTISNSQENNFFNKKLSSEVIRKTELFDLYNKKYINSGASGHNILDEIYGNGLEKSTENVNKIRILLKRKISNEEKYRLSEYWEVCTFMTISQNQTMRFFQI